MRAGLPREAPPVAEGSVLGGCGAPDHTADLMPTAALCPGLGGDFLAKETVRGGSWPWESESLLGPLPWGLVLFQNCLLE